MTKPLRSEKQNVVLSEWWLFRDLIGWNWFGDIEFGRGLELRVVVGVWRGDLIGELAAANWTRIANDQEKTETHRSGSDEMDFFK
jgi:hypothetical protein